MQIAGKTVRHVQQYLNVMDAGSLNLCVEEIAKGINGHNAVSDLISDPTNKAEFDDIFKDDLAEAEKALADCQGKLHELLRG